MPTKYDELLEIDDTYSVHEFRMKNKGLYADGIIAINQTLDSAERTCILAEELGHHYTSYGNIIDQGNLQNKKQELRARAWAAERLLPLDRLIAAFEYGCRNRFETADFLDVTEEFIDESVEYYKRKYGTYAAHGGYIVYFEPFGVMKLF